VLTYFKYANSPLVPGKLVSWEHYKLVSRRCSIRISFGPPDILAEAFLGLSQLYQRKCQINISVRPQPFAAKFFAIHYALIILPFHAV
jgi:hypothetical protein